MPIVAINQQVQVTFIGAGFGTQQPLVNKPTNVTTGAASLPTAPGSAINEARQFTIPVTFPSAGTYTFSVTSRGVSATGFYFGGQSSGANISNSITVNVCTPSISSIKVQGQNVNTIIAGISGVISILGSCLSGLPTISGSGVAFTSPVSTLNGQPTATVCIPVGAVGVAEDSSSISPFPRAQVRD